TGTRPGLAAGGRAPLPLLRGRAGFRLAGPALRGGGVLDDDELGRVLPTSAQPRREGVVGGRGLGWVHRVGEVALLRHGGGGLIAYAAGVSGGRGAAPGHAPGGAGPAPSGWAP